ncbi:Olfactory receptor 7D4 [Sciurus carolinensis]|uniref:Olfactory receptor n=1 Tax=Sciurus carolinensis TaxID=30640 RepID=A0AA41MWK2_SCICA|nr:Olfactory receptor 7D4 [Sciurus carolinensis]
MEVENHTILSQFFLLGISEDPELLPVLFGQFLFMYLVTVLGKLLIILAVSSNSHLHIPIYFFLPNLSLIDIGFTSTIIPKMLVNIHANSKEISYLECLTQVYFFMMFVGMENMLLTIMAYDRFVAICCPLKYTVIINSQLCVLLVLMSWIIMFWFSLILILLVKPLTFTTGTEIPHFFCEVALLLKVAWSDALIGIIFCLRVYLSSAVVHSPQRSTIASVLYTMVTPLLNPFIYSLRDKDVNGALGRLLRTTSCL